MQTRRSYRLVTLDANDEENKAVSAAQRRRRNSINLSEYLLGSRRLRAFPVAMSLIASYISGVTILGTPTEIYNFGTQYWLIVVPIGLMGGIVSTVYLPVYTTLRVTSSYEYLELRFSSTVRTMASALFVLDEVSPDTSATCSSACNELQHILTHHLNVLDSVPAVHHLRAGAGLQSSDRHQYSPDRRHRVRGVHLLHDSRRY